jgi:hypothetical protein
MQGAPWRPNALMKELGTVSISAASSASPEVLPRCAATAPFRSELILWQQSAKSAATPARGTRAGKLGPLPPRIGEAKAQEMAGLLRSLESTEARRQLSRDGRRPTASWLVRGRKSVCKLFDEKCQSHRVRQLASLEHKPFHFRRKNTKNRNKNCAFQRR